MHGLPVWGVLALERRVGLLELRGGDLFDGRGLCLQRLSRGLLLGRERGVGLPRVRRRLLEQRAGGGPGLLPR